MKTRIASSLALAAAIALTASGCALIAPQGTTDPYAPSDGIDLTVAEVDVRNLMLIASADSKSFNVVFTAVNTSAEPRQLRISFVDADGSETGQANFTVDPGTQQFGDLTDLAGGIRPAGEESPAPAGPADTGVAGEDEAHPAGVQIVSLPDLKPGAMVTAYVQVAGGQDVKRQVPVLDGTLKEYQQFVPTEAPADDAETAGER